MKKFIVLSAMLAFIACEDDTAVRNPTDTASRGLSDSWTLPVDDLPTLPVGDSQVDPCLDVTVASPSFCECLPDCCEEQRWYCPPTNFGAVQRKIVTINVCNSENEPCVYGEDEACPPPGILSMGECETIFECNPGTPRTQHEWFDCVLPDGQQGKRKVWCDKGNTVEEACQPCTEEECNNIDDDCDGQVDEGFFECDGPCEPGRAICVDGVLAECDARQPAEEVCNNIDDDCDGEIDENQKNACGECGALPTEECDGVDNNCDGIIDEDLARECETECDRGVEICSGGFWTSCTARQPTLEICDGLDNDCDGEADEDLECGCTPDLAGVLIPCSEPPLECGTGYKTCECLDVDCTITNMSDCLALCAYNNALGVPCHRFVGEQYEEECNNFDDDCDGEVDEELVRGCYTGPPGTLGVGVCLPGEQICSEGLWGSGEPWRRDLCEGEMIPSREICDGADNDCDGEADFGEPLPPTDILLIVDISGSMETTINATLEALGRFARTFEAEEELRWGLMITPVRFIINNRTQERLELVSNLDTLDNFIDAFTSMDPRGYHGGLEMISDAIYIALRNLSPLHVSLEDSEWLMMESEPPLQELFINWRRGADRIIIVFSDESTQSYLVPEVQRGQVEVALAAAPSTVLHAFAPFAYDLDDLALSTGGRRFHLSPRSAAMYENLMTILDEICQAGVMPATKPQVPNNGDNSIRYLPVMYNQYYSNYLKMCVQRGKKDGKSSGAHSKTMHD